MENLGRYAIDALLAGLLGIIIRYGIPCIKSLVTQSRFAFLKKWVQTAVMAAEQKIRGSKMGQEKKAWVVSLLEKVGFAADETVDALIEAAVKYMNDAAAQAETALIQAQKELGP